MSMAAQAEDLNNSLVAKNCTTCHGKEKFCAKVGTLNQDAWRGIVVRMKSNGAKVSDSEIQTIATYLADSSGGKLPLCK